MVKGKSGESVGTSGEEVLLITRTELHVSEFWREMLGVSILVKLRAVWRGDRLFHNLIPVEASEPGMGFDLLSISRSTSKTLGWVLVEQLGA
jgi:hypothetical protein